MKTTLQLLYETRQDIDNMIYLYGKDKFIRLQLLATRWNVQQIINLIELPGKIAHRSRNKTR